jgi:hypothetical protein
MAHGTESSLGEPRFESTFSANTHEQAPTAAQREARGGSMPSPRHHAGRRKDVTDVARELPASSDSKQPRPRNEQPNHF